MSSFTSYAPSSPSPLRRKTMSITQTYFLAHTARGKLSSEAARADHNLRLLVGHANLLDSLMLELADAEAEQESWFNASVQSAASSSKPAHIQWADAIIESPEDEDEEEEEEDSESESDFSDDEDMDLAPLRRVSSHSSIRCTVTEQVSEADDYEDDGEEDYTMLTLTRTNSHSPPELSHDDSDDSEDDSMPPSPPTATATATPLPSFSNQKMYEQGFYQRGLVSAVRVY